jgi:hypothetical protein
MSNSVAWEMFKCSTKCSLVAFIGVSTFWDSVFQLQIIRRKKSRQVNIISEELLGSYVPTVWYSCIWHVLVAASMRYVLLLQVQLKRLCGS